jgi:hypothetical protein
MMNVSDAPDISYVPVSNEGQRKEAGGIQLNFRDDIAQSVALLFA